MNAAERRVMEQALEAMLNFPDDISDAMFESITALKAALAQEPVGYLPAYELNRLQSGHDGRLRSAKFGASALDGDVAVYTAPPPAPVAQQEPVAWRSAEQYSPDVGSWFEYYDEFRSVSPTDGLTPLYTAPPRRKPLTDEEIVDAVREADLDWQAGWTLDEHEPNRFTTLARAIERKVRGEA